MNLQALTEAYLSIYDQKLLTEEFHPEIQSILNSNAPASKKAALVNKKIKELGTDAGGVKIGKGSSRLVFDTGETPITIKSGDKTATGSIGTVSKVAIKNPLDDHLARQYGTTPITNALLLGQHQNKAEEISKENYGILKDNGDGTHSINESHGFVAPVLSAHEQGHHLTMVKCGKFDANEFKKQTGHTFSDVCESLNRHHTEINGLHRYLTISDDKHQKILESEHPFIKGAIDSIENGQLHPGDISRRNVGMIEVPNPEKPGETRKLPALLDAGFTGFSNRNFDKSSYTELGSNTSALYSEGRRLAARRH